MPTLWFLSFGVLFSFSFFGLVLVGCRLPVVFWVGAGNECVRWGLGNATMSRWRRWVRELMMNLEISKARPQGLLRLINPSENLRGEAVIFGCKDLVRCARSNQTRSSLRGCLRVPGFGGARAASLIAGFGGCNIQL